MVHRRQVRHFLLSPRNIHICFISATCSAFLCSVKWRAFSAHNLSNWWRCFLNLLVFCLFTYFCCCCCKRVLHCPVYHLLLSGILGTWRYRRWQMTAGQVCNPGFQCCPVKRTETNLKHLFLINQIEEHNVRRSDSFVCTWSQLWCVLTLMVMCISLLPLRGLSDWGCVTLDCRTLPVTTSNTYAARRCCLLRLWIVLILLSEDEHTHAREDLQ